MIAKVLVMNGPNLNVLGSREPGIYGTTTLPEIEQEVETLFRRQQIEVEFYQSNHEGDLIDKLQATASECDLILINGGALSHYGLALFDALKGANRPVIEVHMSNIYARESWRSKSLFSALSVGGIFGLGSMGYKLALKAACQLFPRG